MSMTPAQFLKNAQHHFRLDSQAHLARLLNRTRQSLSLAKKKGIAIEKIAMQIEKLSNGKLRASKINKNN